MSDQHKYLLDESQLPKPWYNTNADMPVPPQPVLPPGTLEPVTPDFLSVLFPMSLILQEISTERYIEIPEPVREIYKLWRPTPLMRAVRLEKMLDTPAHIYYKYEGVSPVGSHKPNTAVAQAYYNKEAGTKALTTETGAGQWGSAMAMACNFFGLDLEVYMVKVSYFQKPYRRIIMENFCAQVFPSPSDHTHTGPAQIPVLFRRHGRLRPGRQDVHPRPHLHPAGHPRRRPALPRHVAERVSTRQPRRHRAACRQATRDLRRRGPVHADRGHHPRPRKRPRHPRRHRRSAQVQADRREEGHRLQPLRPRPLRHDGLRSLPPRPA